MTQRGCGVGVIVWIGLLRVGAFGGGDDPALPDSRLGVRTAQILLLTRADVQADVGLAVEQRAALRQKVGELHGRALALRGKSGAEAGAERRSIDLEQDAWLSEHLNDEQRRRLREIDLQWEGPGCLVSRTWVSAELGLDAGQQSRIRAVLGEAPRARALTIEQRSARVLAELTPEQQARWRALLGRPFALVRDAGEER